MPFLHDDFCTLYPSVHQIGLEMFQSVRTNWMAEEMASGKLYPTALV